jgi:hypothetical protein
LLGGSERGSSGNYDEGECLWARAAERVSGGVAVRSRYHGARLLAVTVALLAVSLSAAAQAQLSQGPNSPGNVSSVAFDLTQSVWGNVDGAKTSDNNYATSAPLANGTGYLLAGTFGFAIPSPAQITGIEATVEKGSAAATVSDLRVRIVKGGVVGATDRSDADPWPTTDTIVTYGGPNDLWGETWTAADINSIDFGVAIAAQDTLDNARVDHITITVHYELCGNTPAAGCRTSTKGLFIVKDKDDNTKDKIIFKWIKGQSTMQSDFGNPTSTSTTALCIYENGTLVGDAAIPPDATKWQTISTKGYKYKDKGGAASSINNILLKGSSDDKSKVLVKGKGADLPDPNPDFTLPVTVQVISGDTGICFEATFNNAIKNELGFFKGKF